MLKRIICYKTKEPVYYNKGTSHETSCDHFLAYYTHGTLEEAQQQAAKLNEEKPARMFNRMPIDWNAIDHFYASEQEEMY